MKKVSFRKSNKGFTLTEMIVVMAILSILTSVSIYSLNQIYSTRARKFTNELVALMAECKIDALSGAPQLAYLRIYQDGDVTYGCLYEGSPSNEREVKRNELGTNVSCTVTTDKGRTISIGTGEVRIGFERATGALKPLDKTGNTGASAGEQISQIDISGGSYRYTIKVVASTGYYYVE